MEWNTDTLGRSVSSKCWWYTPYDAGWDGCREHGADMSTDDELRAIVEMEFALQSVSEWAAQVVERPISFLPPCGHYFFPRAYLEAVEAIGSQKAPNFLHTCYTADRMRKERMQDYLFCLDAWVADVGHETAAKELGARGSGKVEWATVCRDLWELLGDRTEAKLIRIERILHRQRWWIKSHAWDDDSRDVFGRDTYLGDIQVSRDSYGNSPLGDPYFTEQQTPRVKALKARAEALDTDGDFFWGNPEESWLCAPKAFRYLERELWSVGKGRPLDKGEEVPGFLQCNDTSPDPDAASAWWREFTEALTRWWQAELAPDNDTARLVYRRLGRASDEKRWLVRLLRHRILLLERNTNDGLAKLTAGAGPGWKGTRQIRAR